MSSGCCGVPLVPVSIFTLLDAYGTGWISNHEEVYRILHRLDPNHPALTEIKETISSNASLMGQIPLSVSCSSSTNQDKEENNTCKYCEGNHRKGPCNKRRRDLVKGKRNKGRNKALSRYSV